MDADDVSLPDRLARQVAFMDSNRGVGISGTWYRHLGEPQRQAMEYPLVHEDIVCRHLFAPALAHPTVIMRRSVLAENSLRYSTGKR
jgi:hypothetical protein